jgi:hypothetical protein
MAEIKVGRYRPVAWTSGYKAFVATDADLEEKTIAWLGL